MSFGFQIEGPLYRGVRSTISRATRLESGDRVVLKTNTTDPFSSAAVTRMQHEFELAAPIRSAHVARYLDLVRSSDGLAVVEEESGDRSLAELLSASRPGVVTALHLGAQIAAGLGAIHAHGVTHRSIHPANVVVDTKTWQAKIVDFAAASLLRQAPDPTRRIDSRTIPLAYVSPEQTGRTNRTVDHRTDFYSLGATLYHALTGRPPFQGSDPLALVHAHVAVLPLRASEVDPRVPEQVAKILERLLAKNAEDRYQSARGVAADLEECLRQYRTSGVVEAFPLGQDDVFETFELSEKLYGRETERLALVDALAAAAAGRKLMLRVTGESGIGKSSLVNAIHEPLLDRRGTFAGGKFDPLQRDLPYLAVRQAIGQLCRTLLTLPEPELATWRDRILERVQPNAGLLTELVPDLERVLGPQPPVPATGLIESQTRFDLTLGRLLSAFVDEGRPLVLWLDDVQWSDPASLHAIVALLRAPVPTHLLLIASDRLDPEPEHPLFAALLELEKAAIEIHTVRLGCLKREDVSALLADTLHVPRSELGELARLVVEKTSGNPFFVKEFLRSLHDARILRFSPERGGWTWDLRAIDALAITSNVVELMVQKVERLPAATQDALRLGACLGIQFDLRAIERASGLTSAGVRDSLAPAVRERLVLSLEPSDPPGLADATSGGGQGEPTYRYRFQHDQIRDATYESIPEASRPELHLRLGRALLAGTAPEERGEAIFTVVDQLNRGVSLIEDPAERARLSALANEAGQRSRSAAAYHEALSYFRGGLALMGDDAWATRYPLCLALHLGFVECAYRTRNFDEADAAARALSPRIRTPVERAELYSIRVVMETNRGAYARALQLARDALADLGHPVPAVIGMVPLATARLRVALALRGKRVDDLAALPDLTDARQVATLKMLTDLQTAAYLTDPKLLFWAVLESLRVAVDHGVTGDASVSFIAYAAFLIAYRHDYADALAYGRLALRIAARPDAFAQRSRIHIVFGCLVNAYHTNHLRTSLPIIQKALELGLESGDVVDTCYASNALPMFMFMAGNPVDAVRRETDHSLQFVSSLPNADVKLALTVLRQAMLSLLGETRSPGSFSTDDLDEARIEAEVDASAAPMSRAFYRSMKVMVLTVFGDYAQAVRLVLEFDDIIESASIASIGLTEYGFFASVALAQGLRDPLLDARAIRRVLDKKLRLLEGWAESAPVNFLHKHALVNAELEGQRGRADRAAQLYDQAIRSATANGYRQHAALASELAGRALARRGLPEAARAHLAAARAGYSSWGAAGKVRALDALHPHLAPERAGPGTLDMQAVVQASQALSGEIALPALLERMMRVILQTAGAQRGALLVEEGSRLRTEASLDLQPGSPAAASGEATHAGASERIARYTLRTGEDVVLADAARTGEFTRDPYVVARGSKSILCMAVRHRDRVTGAFFLENELSAGAFTDERRELLRVLVSQAAISLENAGLFEALREEVAVRRRAEATVRVPGRRRRRAGGVPRPRRHARQRGAPRGAVHGRLVRDRRRRRRPRDPRVASVHADPAKAHALEELRERYTPKWDSAQPSARVVRTGEPVFLAEIAERDIDAGVEPEHARLLRVAGTRAVISVPLVARGQILGALTLIASTDARRYGDADVALAVELGRRAAVAIDNSRLYRNARSRILLRDEFLSVAAHELRHADHVAGAGGPVVRVVARVAIARDDAEADEHRGPPDPAPAHADRGAPERLEGGARSERREPRPDGPRRAHP